MKTLVAFALLCAAAVNAQNPPPNTAQPGVGQPQPFPTQGGGTQPFQPGGVGVGQPFAQGQPFGFPGQFPGIPGTFPGTVFPQQNQNVYAVDSQLGKRCVSGVSEWIAIVQGTADYDYSRDLTECPAAQPGQRTFTAKTTNVYVIHQAGYPQAQCTFDRQLFLCLSGGITNQQTCQFNRGQPFPCPVDGNLDPSSQTATINPPSNNVAGFGNFGGWGNFGGFPYGGGVSGFGRPSYGGFGGFASPSIGAQPFGPARFNKRK